MRRLAVLATTTLLFFMLSIPANANSILADWPDAITCTILEKGDQKRTVVFYLDSEGWFNETSTLIRYIPHYIRGNHSRRSPVALWHMVFSPHTRVIQWTQLPRHYSTTDCSNGMALATLDEQGQTLDTRN